MAITRSCSMQKFRPPKNLEAEPISDTSRVQFQEMRRRCSSQKPLQKSRSDLAFQELQGFKDLGFRFEKEDLSPGVVNMLPGLQENKIEELKQDKVRRPYLSEAWLAQSLAPPIPNSVSKNSAADMKAQLKFWARAVATNHLLSSPFPLSLPPLSTNPSFQLFLLQKPISISPFSSHSKTHLGPLLAQAQEPIATVAEAEEEQDGPFELPPSASSSSIFATNDDPSPIQTATSVLLTGAIGVFLFRSLRRRAKRAKELRLRSSGAKKTLKEEALDSLKAMGSASIDTKKSQPSAAQALLGSIAAGVIALILYKFTTTIEAALNRQTISDNFSVRQLTITIRTIVNGICYLATFVFGINSLGLFLLSGQLAINSFMEDSSTQENESKGEEKVGSLSSVAENAVDGSELTNSKEDKSPDDK
ncbi:hypothetical protein CCACVL1_16402 [Corchorus capsularis]|uniref:DUF3082 domain-containing protein n=1 Tax=Corchorus capsularis TaxID=210143 RepID=A0A1R3HXA7_COCAP|nr:hypothetical protein CCACVL1_16402 [Corchorus capsularis]